MSVSSNCRRNSEPSPLEPLVRQWLCIRSSQLGPLTSEVSLSLPYLATLPEVDLMPHQGGTVFHQRKSRGQSCCLKGGEVGCTTLPASSQLCSSSSKRLNTSRSVPAGIHFLYQQACSKRDNMWMVGDPLELICFQSSQQGKAI